MKENFFNGLDGHKNKSLLFVLLVIVLVVGMVGGGVGGALAAEIKAKNKPAPAVNKNIVSSCDCKTSDENRVVNVVEKASPAVVSIVVSKDLPKYENSQFQMDPFFSQFFDMGPQLTPEQKAETEKKQIGSGSGFIVSDDGFIVTNKHVVFDDKAEYTVVLNNEKKYTAKVLAKDPVNDLAVLKIEATKLSYLDLGDSSKVKIGQSVIAIGNALGEFRNTVSTGIVSGLSRSITAGGMGSGAERLIGLIQTDASINPGNSGGPLLNSSGQVIGINVAIAQGAQGIGFAIPINQAKKNIESVRKNGKIVRPWLGLRYAMITPENAKANQLPKDYGALVVRGQGQMEVAVVPGSPADKAGIVENDIILEIDGQKMSGDNDLARTIAAKNIGDVVKFKVYHKGSEKNVEIKLEEAKK